MVKLREKVDIKQDMQLIMQNYKGLVIFQKFFAL